MMPAPTSPSDAASSPTIDTFTHLWRPGATPDAPVLLLLHGTGGDERSLLRLGELVAPQAALLSPRGRVLEGTMPRFFRRLAEGVFDMEDLVRRTHELAEWLALAQRAYAIDPARLVALGYSNGANIAGAMLLLRPTALRRAVLLRPMVPLEPSPLPDLTSARVLISAGERDPITPIAGARRLERLLSAAGATVSFAADAGDHALTSDAVAAARAFVAADAAPQ